MFCLSNIARGRGRGRGRGWDCAINLERDTGPLKHFKHLSGEQVNLSGHAGSAKIFHANFIRTLLKLRLFGLLPINTSLIILRGLKIGDRSLRDLIFFREGLLERKPKVPHHSYSLIQGLVFLILG